MGKVIAMMSESFTNNISFPYQYIRSSNFDSIYEFCFSVFLVFDLAPLNSLPSMCDLNFHAFYSILSKHLAA